MAVPETLPSSSITRFSFFLTACCRTTLGPPAAHPDYVCLLIARRSISLFFFFFFFLGSFGKCDEPRSRLDQVQKKSGENGAKCQFQRPECR